MQVVCKKLCPINSFSGKCESRIAISKFRIPHFGLKTLVLCQQKHTAIESLHKYSLPEIRRRCQRVDVSKLSSSGAFLLLEVFFRYGDWQNAHMKCLSLFLALLISGVAVSASVASGLVPLPVSVTTASGVRGLVLKPVEAPQFQVRGAGLPAAFFQHFLRTAENNKTLFPSPIVFKSIDASDPTGALFGNNPEGYILEIDEEGVEISAQNNAGYFYGLQTLLQLTPEKHGDGTVVLPACKIIDYPRFAWRGFMLDSVRHYQSPEWIKKLIDMLASQKINTLHWHLTDDQGWRIEIKKYPQLTQKAAWRKDIGFGLKPEQSTDYDQDGNYGGFYTQEQVREIVHYAAIRNITIVPEIELPGHALAALSVFPHLGCTGGPYEIGLKGGVFDDVYCAGNEAVYAFLEEVIDEVAQLFPGKFFHVGGDECPKIRWKACPKCQAKIRTEGLRDEHGLQSYVIRRMEKFLAGKGKRLIGWDEILEGGLAPNATVMSWRGASGGIAAARKNHDVVMTPNSHCYFDYSQARTGEPNGIGGFIPLERVYKFNPTEGVPETFSRRVLGGQANLWTEYIPNEKHAEYMIAPRISALAEVLWTPQKNLSWDSFQERMEAQYKRYERAEFNYRKPDGVLIRAVAGGVSFSPDLNDAPVVYTLDGSEPDKNSPRTTAGNYFVKILPTDDSIRVRARAVLRDGSLGRLVERTLNLPKAMVASSMGTTEANFPERCCDGSRTTIYWADRNLRAGDTVTARFEKTQKARVIRCLTGKNENGGGGDSLKNGVLEITEDGKTWREIAMFKDGIAEASATEGIRFKAVRIRATHTQDEWLVVREFEWER